MDSWFSLLLTRQRFEMVVMLSIVTVVPIVGILFNMPQKGKSTIRFFRPIVLVVNGA